MLIAAGIEDRELPDQEYAAAYTAMLLLAQGLARLRGGGNG